MPLNLTILLVDDHLMHTDLLSDFLIDHQIAIKVHRASNGSQALETLQLNNDIQVVFMDCNMPFMDGITCTKTIKEKYPSVKVLFMASTGDPQKVQEAMQAGADGFISKATGKNVIAEALQVIMANGTYLCTHAKNAMADVAIQTVKKQSAFIKFKLTPREREVAPFIAEGLSNKQIAEKFSRTEKTIDGHRTKIYAKTGCHKQTEFMALFNSNKNNFTL